jgi:hypothetical protein
MGMMDRDWYCDAYRAPQDKKAPSPLGGRLAAEERRHDLRRRFAAVTSSSRRERYFYGIVAIWALALALVWLLGAF